MLYYIIPESTSEEIDCELINDPNVKEGNEHYYIYLQEFYIRLLISKLDLKFERPDHMGLETFKYTEPSIATGLT
jgi:hypothetical protein